MVANFFFKILHKIIGYILTHIFLYLHPTSVPFFYLTISLEG